MRIKRRPVCSLAGSLGGAADGVRRRVPSRRHAMEGVSMPDCYLCLPTCENCKPKMVTCSKCGTRTLLDLKMCPLCKEPITDEDRERAWKEWMTRRNA